MTGMCKISRRFGWRIVFFRGIPHPHLLGEPLPESLSKKPQLGSSLLCRFSPLKGANKSHRYYLLNVLQGIVHGSKKLTHSGFGFISHV